MENKFTLYVMRHGETYLNRYQRMQGWADSPLTEEGKQVAIEAGKKLEDVRFDRVYTSDSGRTVETAEVVLQQNQYRDNLSIQRRKEFRETFFGSFEGEKNDVVWNKLAKDNGFHSMKEVFKHHNIEELSNLIKKSDPLHHAENYTEIWTRVEKGLQALVEENKGGGNILLVTHGVTIRHILEKFSKDLDLTTDIKNCSVSILEYNNGNFQVTSFNQ
ncbi:histidine phosphatase family protein [Bacillus pinisoli]|uniref:histidine phosphatase family protein n=1 Tax=Bacillus pinisoli TaxID=2901866 RepID=UPI001FF4F4B4|nr:histidine phosphatase family protein [Bacillus pinisoli]